MQITAEVFKRVVEYVRDELLKQLLPIQYENGYPAEAVSKATVLSLPQLVTMNQFLSATGEKKERKRVAPIEDDKGFSEWWAEYPKTNFTYRGIRFTDDSGTSLRKDEEKCRNLYLRILLENKNITPGQMLNALKTMKRNKMEECYRTGENKMNFFGAAEPFLRQGKFNDFLDTEEVEEETENYTSKYGA
jgi:hypothetical protein